jgi:putative oxidoreductase
MAKEPTSVHPIGWLVLTCRVALGGLFVFAAWLKLSGPQAFADSVLAFKIIPESADHLTTLTTFVVPWTEMVAGVALILGLWARSAALVLSLMLVVFMAGIGSVVYRNAVLHQGIDTHCGCFGRFEWPCTDKVGGCQIGRDLAMLAMGVLVVLKGPGPLAIDRESTR